MANLPWSAFQSGAAYYEVLFDAAQRLEREGPLLRRLLDACPGNRVVDLACGTGHHAVWFAEMGARVTACDLSVEMVALARERRPHPGVLYLSADMRDGADGQWDLAVCLGNSLSLLHSQEDLLRAMRTAADSLVSGGLYLAQVLNYARPVLRDAQHRIVRKQVGEMQVTAVKSLVPEAGLTLLCLAYFAERHGTYASAAETALLRHIDLGLLEAAATDAGLLLDQCYGAFDGSPFVTAESTDLIVVLRKP